MADTPTIQQLRGLLFSATELHEMGIFTQEFIEDYLTLAENFATISTIIDEKQDILRTVVNVNFSDSPYSVNDVDQTVVFDTTGGDIIANLPVGIVGRTYRMTNTGTGGNKVIINPDGSEFLFGVNGVENLYDYETLDMTFDTEKGWW